MMKRVLTLVNAMQCTVLPHITASVFIKDEAGASTGGTTALERMPVWYEGQGLAEGKLGRCAPEAAWAAA